MEQLGPSLLLSNFLTYGDKFWHSDRTFECPVQEHKNELSIYINEFYDIVLFSSLKRGRNSNHYQMAFFKAIMLKIRKLIDRSLLQPKVG